MGGYLNDREPFQQMPVGQIGGQETGVSMADEICEDPAGQTKLRDKTVVPAAGGAVDKLGGGGNGIFGADIAGQMVKQQVRHHQQCLRLVQQFGPLCSKGGKLIDSVAAEKLDTGAPIDRFPAEVLRDRLHDPLRSEVTIGDGPFEQGSFFVQKSEIQPPCVDADTADAEGSGIDEGTDHILQQCRIIP